MRTQMTQDFITAMNFFLSNRNQAGEQAVIASSFTWSPDEEASEKFGGDGILLAINPKTVKMLENIAKHMDHGILSINLPIPAGIDVDIIEIDTIGEPMPLGHGDNMFETARRLGKANECEEKGLEVSYDHMESGTCMQICRDSFNIVKSMYVRGTLHGRYEASLSIDWSDLNQLVNHAFKHQMSEDEMIEKGVFCSDKPQPKIMASS